MKRKPKDKLKNWWKNIRYELSKINGQELYS
jgi:hypothetical protein